MNYISACSTILQNMAITHLDVSKFWREFNLVYFEQICKNFFRKYRVKLNFILSPSFLTPKPYIPDRHHKELSSDQAQELMV